MTYKTNSNVEAALAELTLIGSCSNADLAFEKLMGLLDRLSAEAPSANVIEYEGASLIGKDQVRGIEAAASLSAQLGSKWSTLDETDRGRFLAHPQVFMAIREIFSRTESKAIAFESTYCFLYGQKGSTPNARSLWGKAADEFSASATGDVIALVSQAGPNGAFNHIDFPNNLMHANTVNGVAVCDLNNRSASKQQ